MSVWFKYLKRPKPHAKDTKAFWDDEHISSYMLAAHLDKKMDAASRNDAFMDASVSFIKQRFPPSTFPEVLDLGCGPGLYCHRLSQEGYVVSGMDISRRSINYAELHFPGNTYIHDSFFNLDKTHSYDIITFIYCEYGVFSDSERKRLLEKIHQALKPGGVLILDVFTPKQFSDRKEDKSWAYEEKGGFFSPEPHLLLSAFYRYPNDLFLEQFVIVEKTVDTIYNWHQTFTDRSLRSELELSGFNTEEIYGDLTGTPYDDTLSTVAIMARKKGD